MTLLFKGVHYHHCHYFYLTQSMITNDLLVVSTLTHFMTPCEPGSKFTHGSDHYWLAIGYSSALAHFTTPCELALWLHATYILFMFFIPSKNAPFFIGWFLSFYWCYMHRHTEMYLRLFNCLPETLLPLLSKSHSHSKKKKYKNNVVSNILECVVMGKDCKKRINLIIHEICFDVFFVDSYSPV